MIAVEEYDAVGARWCDRPNECHHLPHGGSNVRSGGASAVLPTREVASIRKDVGAVNYLRIEVDGERLSFFVNGELFGSANRNVTDGGMLIGLQVATFGPAAGVWDFDDITATTLNPSTSQ